MQGREKKQNPNLENNVMRHQSAASHSLHILTHKTLLKNIEINLKILVSQNDL
jgi:hypothetical protein